MVFITNYISRDILQGNLLNVKKAPHSFKNVYKKKKKQFKWRERDNSL